MESGLYSYKFLKAQLAVALGGRVAEEMAVGKDEVTTGASNDLQQVRGLARRMIAQWGFLADEANRGAGNTLRAPVAWEMPEKQMVQPATASGETERLIDAEVKQLVEKETIDAQAFQKMVLEHTSSDAYVSGLQTA